MLARIETTVAVLLFAAVFVADLFYFHQLGRDTDLFAIVSAATALGIKLSFGAGVNVIPASPRPPEPPLPPPPPL